MRFHITPKTVACALTSAVGVLASMNLLSSVKATAVSLLITSVAALLSDKEKPNA